MSRQCVYPCVWKTENSLGFNIIDNLQDALNFVNERLVYEIGMGTVNIHHQGLSDIFIKHNRSKLAVDGVISRSYILDEWKSVSLLALLGDAARYSIQIHENMDDAVLACNKFYGTTKMAKSFDGCVWWLRRLPEFDHKGRFIDAIILENHNIVG